MSQGAGMQLWTSRPSQRYGSRTVVMRAHNGAQSEIEELTQIKPKTDGSNIIEFTIDGSLQSNSLEDSNKKYWDESIKAQEGK